MVARADVVVIGGGVVGAAITYYLARAGAAVTLVERGEPGCWTSRTSFAWINALAKRPEHYHRFSRLGMETYDELEEDLGTDAGLGRGGALHWPAPGPEGRAAMEAQAEELRQLDYPFELLSVEEAAELEPNITVAGVDGAILYAHTERWADGQLLAKALVRRASEHGAKLLAPCSAREILLRNGHTDGVATSEGVLTCDRVVVAAGAASVGLLAPMGFPLPLDRAVGILAVTTAAPDVVRRVLYPGVYHLRPMSDGRVAIGCRGLEALADADTDTSAPPSWADRLLNMARRDVTGLEDVSVAELRVAPRPLPADALPVIGPVPGVAGAYVAVMHSGVTLAGVVGRTVAQEVSDGRPSPLLEPYRPNRFDSGQVGM